ncbi:hypothetical protein EVAR_84905_1 [Eumeta japonica]|uniref:Uncharacterized protein n=1 Tax=Eumeta variegata TaxID=151549 RepID=A0A4C1Z5Y1_EUMVA|nr:hypothetical protein EVAR_84905_1 [Eumeta japonica]
MRGLKEYEEHLVGRYRNPLKPVFVAAFPKGETKRSEITVSVVTFRPVSESSGGPLPFINPKPPSALHKPSSFSIRYPIPTQETGNALETSSSRVAMGRDDHIYFWLALRVPGRGQQPHAERAVAGAARAAAQPRARRVPAGHRQLLPPAQRVLQLHHIPELHRPLRPEGRAAEKEKKKERSINHPLKLVRRELQLVGVPGRIMSVRRLSIRGLARPSATARRAISGADVPTC